MIDLMLREIEEGQIESAWKPFSTASKTEGKWGILERNKPVRSYPYWDIRGLRKTFTKLNRWEIQSWGPRIMLYGGPSAIGKDFSLDSYISNNQPKEMSVCRLPLVTTRQPREGKEKENRISSNNVELDKERYFFVSKENFTEMVEMGLMIAWRERETGDYYGLLYPMVRQILQDSQAIAVVTCGLRLGWLIKKSLGGLPTIIYACGEEKILRHWYTESERAEEEVDIRLDFDFYNVWAPLLADYLIVTQRRGDLVWGLSQIIDSKVGKINKRGG